MSVAERITIRSVADKGDAEKERLVLAARVDMDIGDYILIQTGFLDGSVTIDIHYTYWFPYKKIEAGDLVVLYTKSGQSSQKELEEGKKVHFFYWGLSEPIWSTEDRSPVLLHAPEWISKAPNEL